VTRVPSTVPIFGSRLEGFPYVIRPSAYVLVRNSSAEIALVRTAKGYFLPGGGIEAGETPAQAAAREAMEECGFVLSPCRYLTSAVDIVLSEDETVCFEKRSVFFEADLRETIQAQEPDHEVFWGKREQVMELLSHPSHRWAVGQLAGND
jgi:8-oxo-dGTP diphosphatase